MPCYLASPESQISWFFTFFQVLLLDTVLEKKQHLLRVKQNRRQLSSRQRQALKCFDIFPEHQKYDLHLPLHHLWRGYMRSLLMLEQQNPMHIESQQKLLKADYHGCIMTVTKSSCPSLVGLSGIMLQETKCTWKIITASDQLKIIPKSECVFSFELDGFVFTLYGKHFSHRPADRCSKKYKTKATLDL